MPNPWPPEKVQALRRGDQGWFRCPRRRRPSGPHLAFAPSAPDQRSAFDGDRSLRSPFVLWTGIWKRFHMFTTGDPELALSPDGGWNSLATSPR